MSEPIIMWAHGLLDAAQDAPAGDARDAILTRLGAVLVASCGVWIDNAEMPSAARKFKVTEAPKWVNAGADPEGGETK